MLGWKGKGPGSFASTQKAYELVAPLMPNTARIADLGSGPGLQTIHLAQLSSADAHILAVDMHLPYLKQLEKKRSENNFENKISIKHADIIHLSGKDGFEKSKFNLIWSEGTIYIIGYTKALRFWRQFLCKGGCIAISEVSWLTNSPKSAGDAYTYWNMGYPEMRTIDENIDVLKRLGYTSLGHFILPQEDWWAEYYTPIEERIQILLERHKGDIDIIPALQAKQREIDIFRKYNSSFGYVFYIGCKD